jgi:hypothetical protein
MIGALCMNVPEASWSSKSEDEELQWSIALSLSLPPSLSLFVSLSLSLCGLSLFLREFNALLTVAVTSISDGWCVLSLSLSLSLAHPSAARSALSLSHIISSAWWALSYP